MKRCLLFLSVALLVASCTKYEESEMNPAPDRGSDSWIVLQERDPSLPTVPNRMQEIAKRPKAVSGLTGRGDYLGMGYKDKTTILGDPENFTSPVFDISKFRTDHPDWYANRGLYRSEATYYTYTSDSQFESQSQYSKKVSKGFSLNLGLFSIGRKKTIENVFSTSSSTQSRDAYGELSIDVQHELYSINTSSLINGRIAGEYLRPDFIESMYNMTIDELLETYGTFVATGYYTGGRASALFYGKNFSTTSATSRQEGLQRDIEASFSWKKYSGSGNLNLGRTNGSSGSGTQKFESVFMNLKTIGGSASTGVSLGARNVDQVNIDMSSWLNSLSNMNTHTVIGLQDEGLHPISDFLLEENFRRRIQQTHLGKMSTKEQQIPAIEITKVFVRTSNDFYLDNLYEIAAILNTRHGDKIIISDGTYKTATDDELLQNQTYSVAMNKTSRLRTGLQNFFRIGIKANPQGSFFPAQANTVVVRADAMDVSRMQKIINQSTGMVYLYDAYAKVALAFPNDNYTVNVYGMQTFLNIAPTGTLSMTTLERDYTVYGL